VSVQEVHGVRVRGISEGLRAASRLAALAGALPRWAALWLDPERLDDRARHAALVAHFGGRVAEVSPGPPEALVVCIASPTPEDIAELAADAQESPFIVHFGPPLYVGETGPEPPWIAFVDPAGCAREDARVYRIELAGRAEPLSAGDRPWDTRFAFGPLEAQGWEIRVVTIRDHLPRAALVRWLAEAMDVPVEAVLRDP
jgi:hypothetical protein